MKPIAFALALGILAALGSVHAHEPLGQQDTAQEAATTRQAVGIVFSDLNRNGVRDQDEPGIEGIRVSNGRDIAKTGVDGHYTLSVDDDDILFVIKPRNWMTPLNEDHLPRFYYIHKPHGSPDLKFGGVKPTGELPASVDFPLQPSQEPEEFKALFFGDTQPRDIQEVEYIAHDVIEQVIGEKAHGASLGVTLGDIVFDDLSLMDPLNKAIALIGIPWHNVLGNHDMNLDAKDDAHSDETFERIYGPSYYSFDHGPVHFLVLDDVRWFIPEGQGRGRYVGGLGPEQMQFVRNDLALLPEDQLVVLMMHIPLVQVEDRKELYDLISKRPFALSVSAHTHTQAHVFIGKEGGFQGPKPHHHVINVTVCGSWWRGAPDERGIPHTTMADGAPNGYSIFTFNGHDYAIEYRAAGRPADYQMNIYAPEEIEAAHAANTQVLVNVFAGSERSKVEMQLGDQGDWMTMEPAIAPDPAYLATKEREDEALAAILARQEDEKIPLNPPFITLPNAAPSSHIWQAKLPANPPKGTLLIHVRFTDMFGRSHSDRRSIRVR